MKLDIHLSKKKAFQSFLMLFISFNAIAQLDSINYKHVLLKSDEHYILNFNFDSVVYSNNCPCFMGKRKKCKLIKGSVSNIYFNFEGNTGLMTREEIMNTAFILVSDTFKFNKGQRITLSAFSTIEKRYFILSKRINLPEISNSVFQSALIQIPGNCYKFSFLRWLTQSGKIPKDKYIRKDVFSLFIDNN